MHSSDAVKIESSIEKSLKQAGDLTNLPVQSLFDIISKLKSEVQSMKDDSDLASAELKQKTIEVKELRDQLSFIKETNKLLSTELLNLHRGPQVREHSESSDESTPESSKAQINALKSEKLKLLEKLKKSTSDVNSLSLENIRLQEDIDVLQFSKNSLELELTTLKDALALKINKFKDNFEAEIQGKDKKIKKLETEISELQEEMQKTKRNLQQEIKDTQEENMKTHRASEKELEKFKRDKVRDDDKYRAELDSAKQMYAQVAKKNEILVRKLKAVKAKQASSQQNSLQSTPVASSSDKTPTVSLQTIHSMKDILNTIYKQFLGEISRNCDGDASYYQLQSKQFTSIEKQLNDLISLFSDNIEDTSPLKENSKTGKEAEGNRDVLSWLTPRLFKGKQKKSAMSLRNSEKMR